MNEPAITINGERLTEAQAMTVRVAIETFSLHLSSEETADVLGMDITQGYLRRIGEMRSFIYRKPTP